MKPNDLNNPKTVTVLTGIITSGLLGPLVAIGAIGISIYGISKLFSDKNQDTGELEGDEPEQVSLPEAIVLQQNQGIERYKEPLYQPLIQPRRNGTTTALSTVKTTVNPTVFDGEMEVLASQELSPEERQELIRMAMSELGKKSAEARRRKKAGL